MTLSTEDKHDFEKDLNNSERFILEKMSSDRKSSHRKFEKVNADVSEVLREIKLMNANLETNLLLQQKLEKEVWLVSFFYNHKKLFLTIVAIFIFTFGDKIMSIYDVLKSKFIGG